MQDAKALANINSPTGRQNSRIGFESASYARILRCKPTQNTHVLRVRSVFKLARALSSDITRALKANSKMLEDIEQNRSLLNTLSFFKNRPSIPLPFSGAIEQDLKLLKPVYRLIQKNTTKLAL